MFGIASPAAVLLGTTVLPTILRVILHEQPGGPSVHDMGKARLTGRHMLVGPAFPGASLTGPAWHTRLPWIMHRAETGHQAQRATLCMVQVFK